MIIFKWLNYSYLIEILITQSIWTSVGVEPTNAACALSTATLTSLTITPPLVKDVRRCSARHARRIRGFSPHRSGNIYMDYFSTVVEKDKCRCYRLREISYLFTKITVLEPLEFDCIPKSITYALDMYFR